MVFEELKKRMTGTPLIEKAKPGKAMHLNLEISYVYFRIVPVRIDIKVKKPIYYDSEVFCEHTQKFALVMTKA